MQQRTLAGRYQLQRALGHGAIGQVWLAWDAQTQRSVAVKTIQIGRIPNPEYLMDTLGRFQREVAAANKLQHPNIVAAFDSGRTADELYLVMELADGGSLAELMEQRYNRGDGQWPVPDVLTVAGQVCAGLSAAHAAEIVHRDIKPSNLMIDANQRVKIIDFGMALLLDDRSPRLTRQGQAVGTLAYMPPEQIDGAEVDGRTDLYSLGCVMYELFAGQRPFNAETPEALMIQHLYHQPPPLRSFRPDLAQDLAQLIEQMLAKEKEHRPSGAREVFARIGAIGVAVENLESSRVTMLAPDPVLPPSGYDVFSPESDPVTMHAPDPASPLAHRATQESEPVYRTTQDPEPVRRGTELAEPVHRGTELAEPEHGPTNLATGLGGPAKLGPPAWRGDQGAPAGPPAGLPGSSAATHDADPRSAGYRGGPAAGSAGVVRFGPGLPQEPPGARPPSPPSPLYAPSQQPQPSWPDRQQIEARHREARQSQSPQRRPGRARQRLLTIGACVVVAAIAAVVVVLLHRSHAALKVTAVAAAPATLPGHKCNITVDIVGTIETNGDAGQLMYQWVRNGDLTSRVFSVHLTAANGTSVTAHLHWRFVGKGVSHSTAQLRVLSPNVASAKTAFVYACRS